MDNDRALLEDAARAAGIAIVWPIMAAGRAPVPILESSLSRTGPTWWNPLTDDGDALRLAVKLGIGLDRTSNRCWTFPAGMAISGVYGEFYEGDPYAATRRAIVRAAAAQVPPQPEPGRIFTEAESQAAIEKLRMSSITTKT